MSDQANAARKLSAAERERVSKLCRVLLTERRVWSARFKRWLDLAVAERNAAGMDRVLEHDPRTNAVREELMSHLRQMLPDREVGGEELNILLDLYAEVHGYRWDGERAGPR